MNPQCLRYGDPCPECGEPLRDQTVVVPRRRAAEESDRLWCPRCEWLDDSGWENA